MTQQARAMATDDAFKVTSMKAVAVKGRGKLCLKGLLYKLDETAGGGGWKTIKIVSVPPEQWFEKANLKPGDSIRVQCKCEVFELESRGASAPAKRTAERSSAIETDAMDWDPTAGSAVTKPPRSAVEADTKSNKRARR